MSPRWATVGECDLYFYAHERHQRPHVDVRGPGFNATVTSRREKYWRDALRQRLCALFEPPSRTTASTLWRRSSRH